MFDVLAQVLRELGADRFRTRLSLLGVAVGIFSIVAALTLVNAVQESIREGFSAYGGDHSFYIHVYVVGRHVMNKAVNFERIAVIAHIGKYINVHAS